MKTKTIPIYSIQVNMLGAIVEDKTCKVLLANGNQLRIVCDKNQSAIAVHDKLMYYPIGNRPNNAIELNFEIELNYVVIVDNLSDKK